MSFSRDIKAELCRNAPGCDFCAAAECFGILLYCNTFSGGGIRVVTEHRDFAAALPRLFRRAFNVRFDAAPQGDAASGKRVFVVNAPEKLETIFETYGFSSDNMLAHHINLGVLESECCRRSFMRGAFLAGGSVTDPAKRYHLELVTGHYNVNREMYTLLLEMDFEPKEMARSGSYVVYFKQSGAIEDFLTLIGAPVAAMDLMSAKIEKSMRNSVNRRVNCDTANVTKTVEAAQQQIDAINRLNAARGLDGLPEKLRQTAYLRLEHPELSLAELGGLCLPPVTKSCVNHRMRKLTNMSSPPAASAANGEMSSECETPPE
ncbi:MAG: DNA-binding protein WhiA [Oscillospiraceae bacterium]|jgi:DNA-binding protein WhiA|nr:DNA-binding protein WhiA [Oscillospiraceae bacterium]